MTIQLLTPAVVLIAAVSFRWEHFSHSLLMRTLRFMVSSLSASGQQHAGREITITGINSLLITLHCIGPHFTQCDLPVNMVPGSLFLLNIMYLWWTGYPASSGIILLMLQCTDISLYVHSMAVNGVNSSTYKRQWGAKKSDNKNKKQKGSHN